MIKGNLTLALDVDKKKGQQHEKFSYRDGEQWYLVRCGPGYSNTYKISEYDGDGLKRLKELERTDDINPLARLEGRV